MNTVLTDEEIRNKFPILKPMNWSMAIGATGVSSQIPDDIKWAEFTHAVTHLFVKEFVPNYHGSSIVPPWEYWMKHGMIIDTASSGVVIEFADMVRAYGEERIRPHLGRCMPRYIKYERPGHAQPDPYANAVPMPGAGKATPTIKDVKGERLS